MHEVSSCIVPFQWVENSSIFCNFFDQNCQYIVKYKLLYFHCKKIISQQVVIILSNSKSWLLIKSRTSNFPSLPSQLYSFSIMARNSTFHYVHFLSSLIYSSRLGTLKCLLLTERIIAYIQLFSPIVQFQFHLKF